MSLTQTNVLSIVTFGGYYGLALICVFGRFFFTLYRKWKLRKFGVSEKKTEEQYMADLILKSSANTWRFHLEQFFQFSRFGVVWLFFQMMVTLVSCYAYVHETYGLMDGYIPSEFYGLEMFLSISISIDFVKCFLIAYDKGFYFLAPYPFYIIPSPFPFIDWVTVVPFFVFCAYGDPFGLNATPSGIFIHSLRFLRAFRAVRLYRLIPEHEDSDPLHHRLLQVVVSLIVLFYVAVSTMQVFEENFEPIAGWSSNSPFYWHTSLYYMTVTMTTTGYGDIAPHTDPGRGVIIIFLLWGVTLIPFFIGSLLTLIHTINKYDRTRYSTNGQYQHILIIGNVSARNLQIFLREWYHKDSSNQNVQVVVVSTNTPNDDMEKLLTSRFLFPFLF